jgi:hypothetical protein
MPCLQLIEIFQINFCDRPFAKYSEVLKKPKRQKQEKSFETITQTFKYGEKQYTISFKLFSDDKMEEIPGKDNEAFRALLQSNPECVISFESENGGTFFRNREEFCQAFAPAKVEKGATRAANTCSGGGNARVRFYKHNFYNTQMDVRVAGDGLNEYLAYHTNFGGPFCLCSDVATNTGTQYNTKGFRLENVGRDANDQLSSLIMESYTKSQGPTSVANYDPLHFGQGFNTVLFNHVNFRGSAISFYVKKCAPSLNVDRLSKYRFVWYFASWNDRVSSYYGYYVNI